MKYEVSFRNWKTGETFLIYSSDVSNIPFYDGVVERETNSPGSFDFTIGRKHSYYDELVPMIGSITVTSDGETIFIGRIISVNTDIKGFRGYHCEGLLGVLYDTIQPRKQYNGTAAQLLPSMLAYHNGHVRGWGTSPGIYYYTKVNPGTIDIVTDSELRYTNRETTLETIQDKITDRFGGRLELRQGADRQLYLDYFGSFGDIVNQEIRLGSNLLTYAHTADYTPIATACIPLGAAQTTTEIAALDGYLTINGGTGSFEGGTDTPGGETDFVQLDAAVAAHGFICKVVKFDDITTASRLRTAGLSWLQSGQYEEVTLDLTAVDLHNLGYDGMEPLALNKQVRVISELHGLNQVFPITKRTYHLTAPEQDTVQLGGKGRKESYTAAVRKATAKGLKPV